MSKLDLISSDELIMELSNRHVELIVIRNHQRIRDEDKIFIKTPFGSKGRQDLGFDLITATDMLIATQRQLVWEYLPNQNSLESNP